MHCGNKQLVRHSPYSSGATMLTLQEQRGGKLRQYSMLFAVMALRALRETAGALHVMHCFPGRVRA
jgi:hypothetical protein